MLMLLMFSVGVHVAKQSPVWELTVHSVNCACLSGFS